MNEQEAVERFYAELTPCPFCKAVWFDVSPTVAEIVHTEDCPMIRDED